jgi:glucose-6-phosphate 1-epimerase
MEELESLNSKFSIKNSVRFDAGEGGMSRAVLTAGDSFAHVYLQGAHVALFQPAEAEPVLFLSKLSVFRDGKTIRGGVPIIFPWFGNHKTNSSLPAHGFVRTRFWSVSDSGVLTDGRVKLVMEQSDDEATRALWPHAFLAKFTVVLGEKLELKLEVLNKGETAFQFEEALHSYFRVGDIRQISVTGLKDTDYIDKVDGMRLKRQADSAVTFEGETDRVYLDTETACVIADPSLNRNIFIEKSGSASTVVWNPWSEKAVLVSDLGDDEWQSMVCVETGNADRNAIMLAPEMVHALHVRIGLG